MSCTYHRPAIDFWEHIFVSFEVEAIILLTEKLENMILCRSVGFVGFVGFGSMYQWGLWGGRMVIENVNESVSSGTIG